MLKYALGILALIVAIATGLAQAPSTPLPPPKTSAEAESRANDAHLKMLAAFQRLQANPDFNEWMAEKSNEETFRTGAGVLRQQENDKRRQDEMKKQKTAAPK